MARNYTVCQVAMLHSISVFTFEVGPANKIRCALLIRGSSNLPRPPVGPGLEAFARFHILNLRSVSNEFTQASIFHLSLRFWPCSIHLHRTSHLNAEICHGREPARLTSLLSV